VPPSSKRALLLLGLLASIAGLAFALQLLRSERGDRPIQLAFGRPIDQTTPLKLRGTRAPTDLGERAMSHCRELVALGPRYFGQPGWSKQLDYIVKTLSVAGVAARRDTWTNRRELITFSNVSAIIPGDQPGRIVLACHHDTKCTTGHPVAQHNFDFIGANDGASAVGLLLALAPALKARSDRPAIELVFFDGEESLDFDWNDDRALFGSKRYVKRHLEARAQGATQPIAAMLLLDMVGRADLHIQEDLYSDARLRQICWSAAVATGHDEQFFRVAEAAKDDHVPFLLAGIPAIDLIDLNGNPYWHTVDDTLEHMSAESLQAVADVVLTMVAHL
jgi:glutaminyl-peptide cyclotransferase